MKLDHLCRREQGIDHIPMVGAMATPLKCGNVLRHGDVVEFNRAHQCFMTQRHPAFLPSKAQQHGVDVDGVTQDLGGHAVGIKRAQAF